VSDRGEYASNATSAHVDGYDDTAPGWGETAEGAWGGIGQSNGQGVFTRDFIAGGWTWTAHDYRGEPTPYAWPNVNSHFGIIDAAGFNKDRYYWYKAHNPPVFTPSPPAPPTVLHVFPHWTWPAGTSVKVWAFSNAQEVELFVNGVSAGRKPSPTWGHVEWDGVAYAPGAITAVGYVGGVPVATMSRNTTGAPARLAISVKDGAGASLMAGCDDAALVQVEVLDAAGLLVDAAPVVTFSVSGPAALAGTANGDPSGHYNNKSPARPAYHGLVMGVVLAGVNPGSVVVRASAPGLPPVSLTIPQVKPPAGFAAPWCPNGEPI
jgi:beta-galactosidase